MIEVAGLRKSYAGRRRGEVVDAVRGVTFSCAPGEIVGLLGPNGAGKTTTLRMISTALKPSAGTAFVMGFDAASRPAEVRRRIGFLSANTGLYGRLSPREVLVYFGKLFGVERGALARRVGELSEMFGLGEFLDRPCDKLSTGMKQRVNIARTVVHSPPVMVFDEPTSGLDVLASRTIVEFIRRCKDEGKTVLLSSHHMPEVGKLCDAVVMIHQGSQAFRGTLDEFRARYGDDLDDAFVRLIEEAC